MTDFSSAIRIVTTLVLVLVSILVWRWLQAVSATSGHATTATATAGKKKPTKKKTTKKKKKAVADAATPSTTTVDVVDANVAMAAVAAPNDSEDDSDDDDAGLTAKQILARRRFKPKAFGGQSAAAAAAVTAEAVSAARFQVGQRIVARFQDGPDWFPGEILEVRRGNEYHVKYDDGEVERHVPHARIQDEAAAKQAEAVKGVSDTRLNANAEDEADGSGSSYASEDHDGDESEDGWQVVDKKRRSAGSASAPVPDAEKVDAEGLTKRQRENRRKKERKKELKEMIRAQAQEQGLHARWGGTMSRLKYVPPPTSSTPPS